MKLKHIFFTLLLSISSNASAVLMKFNFSGTLDKIRQSDCISCELASSDFYQGSEFSIGDSFKGNFQYETNSSYSLSDDGFQATHLRAVTEHAFSIEENNFPSMSLQSESSGHLSIINDRVSIWKSDSYFVTHLYRGTDWFMHTFVSLADNSGSIYNSFDIPTTFDTTDFSSMIFHVGFLRKSDSLQLHLDGNITNISVQPVPVPGSVWFFGSAIIGIIGIYKKPIKNKAVIHEPS